MTISWSPRRCARLGYLVALGWDAARIAADSTVRSSASEVHRQAQDLGLAFRHAVAATPYNLDGARMAYFDAAARPRRLPTEALLRKLLEQVCDERLLAADTAILLAPPSTGIAADNAMSQR